MSITIEQRDGWWYLTLSDEGEAVKYRTLWRLAKALTAFAKGQNL